MQNLKIKGRSFILALWRFSEALPAVIFGMFRASPALRRWSPGRQVILALSRPRQPSVVLDPCRVRSVGAAFGEAELKDSVRSSRHAGRSADISEPWNSRASIV